MSRDRKNAKECGLGRNGLGKTVRELIVLNRLGGQSTPEAMCACHQVREANAVWLAPSEEITQDVFNLRTVRFRTTVGHPPIRNVYISLW